MELQIHPCIPHGELRRVRIGFRQLVAEQFGQVYSTAALAVRHAGTSNVRYSPVFNAPGGTPAFCWPSVDLPDRWLEPMQEDLVVEKHVEGSQASVGQATQMLLIEFSGRHQIVRVGY